MSSLKRNVILYLILFYAVIYGVLFWTTGYETTAVFLSMLIFGVSSIVFVTWASTAYRSFVSGGREGEMILAFSICVAAAYSVYTRVWILSKVALDSPDWMDKSPIGLGSAVLLLIFFTGVLLAPETKGGHVPVKNLIFWGIAIFIAGLSIGVVISNTIMHDTEAAPIRYQSAPVLSCEPPRPVFVNAYCRKKPGG